MNRWLATVALSATLLPAVAQAQDAAKSAPPPVADLVLKLSAKDPKARLDACTALRSRWPDAARAVPALIEVADDDESADVKKAAVETLGVLGDEGGKTFAAWVKGIGPQEKEEMSAFLADVRRLGPAVAPTDYWFGYQGELRSGWPLVVAVLYDSMWGEWMSPGDPVPALESKNQRARAAALATAGTCARKRATRHGVPVAAGSAWTTVATTLVDGSWDEGRWLGMGVFVAVIPGESRVRERLLAMAAAPPGAGEHDVWAALVRGGRVPPEKAAALVTAGDPGAILRYGRRLGILDAAVLTWGTAEGEGAAAKRWLAVAFASKDPAVAALVRRAERDPASSGNASWADEVLQLASCAKSADLQPLLEITASSLPSGLDDRREREYGAMAIRAVAAVALLDVDPHHERAAKELRDQAVQRSRYGRRALAALGPGVVELPPDADRDDHSSEGPLRAAARGGAEATAAIPRLVEIAAECRWSPEDENASTYSPFVYAELASVLRALGRIGPPAAAALPEIRQHLNSPDAHIVHIARTAIRRIEAK